MIPYKTSVGPWTVASTSRSVYRARYICDLYASHEAWGLELQRRERFLFFFSRWHYVFFDPYLSRPLASAPSFERVRRTAERWESLPPQEKFV